MGKILLLILVVLMSYSCKVDNQTVQKDVIGKNKTVVGLVEVYKNDVYIVANYTSRSRISYLVEGKLKDRIRNLKGKVIEVEGTAKRYGWSGTIKVEKIEKIIPD